MAARFSKWAPFPHDAKAYAYAGDALKKAWPALHAGDQEPYPDEKRAKALIAAAGKAAKGMTADDLAQRLQDAWRAFHRGDFRTAYEAGEALGPLGASVAVKAIGIHATYLVDDEAEQLKRFEHAAQLAEAAVKALPDEANSHYRHAFALGRYSQGISIAKALKQGIADCIAARELIKVKVLENSEYSAREAADILCEALDCECVQVIGRKFVLFKQKKKESAYTAVLAK